MLTKAVIPAAGFGTRFLPATKASPKEMLPVVDTPVIQYVVEEAVSAGITDILMVISHGKRAIEEHFDRAHQLEETLARQGKNELRERMHRISQLADIHFIWQQEMNGLGDAVHHARHHIGDQPFAILLGDTILHATGGDSVTGQLLAAHRQHGGSVVAVEEVAPERVGSYGVVDGREIAPDLFRVVDLVEKPSPDAAPSNLAIASRYVLEPDIFDHLERTGRGRGGEVQLTDAMRVLARERPMFARRIAGKRYDIGNKLGFIKATVELGLEHPDIAPDLRTWLAGLVREDRV